LGAPAVQAPQSFYGSPPVEEPQDDGYSGQLPVDIVPIQVCNSQKEGH
jgi:hypothetical protein